MGLCKSRASSRPCTRPKYVDAPTVRASVHAIGNVLRSEALQTAFHTLSR